MRSRKFAAGEGSDFERMKGDVEAEVTAEDEIEGGMANGDEEEEGGMANEEEEEEGGMANGEDEEESGLANGEEEEGGMANGEEERLRGVSSLFGGGEAGAREKPEVPEEAEREKEL